MPVNFPESPISSLFRRLRATKALRGVPIAAGAPSLPKTTGPGRIVLWPAEGTPQRASDVSVSHYDIEQRVVAEIWAWGSSTGADDARVLAAWDAAWGMFTALTQALAEQGENPTADTDPGLFWQLDGTITWGSEKDTSSEGVLLQVALSAVCPVGAAADDTGHVGDNWPTGEVGSVEITGIPE